MKEISPEFVWNVPKLAKHIGSGPNTIYSLIYKGKLKAFMLNPGGIRKNWRVYHRDWRAYVEKYKVKNSRTS